MLLGLVAEKKPWSGNFQFNETEKCLIDGVVFAAMERWNKFETRNARANKEYYDKDYQEDSHSEPGEWLTVNGTYSNGLKFMEIEEILQHVGKDGA